MDDAGAHRELACAARIAVGTGDSASDRAGDGSTNRTTTCATASTLCTHGADRRGSLLVFTGVVELLECVANWFPEKNVNFTTEVTIYVYKDVCVSIPQDDD